MLLLQSRHTFFLGLVVRRIIDGRGAGLFAHSNLWAENTATTADEQNRLVVFNTTSFYAHNEYEFGSWRSKPERFTTEYIQEHRKYFGCLRRNLMTETHQRFNPDNAERLPWTFFLGLAVRRSIDVFGLGAGLFARAQKILLPQVTNKFGSWFLVLPHSMPTTSTSLAPGGNPERFTKEYIQEYRKHFGMASQPEEDFDDRNRLDSVSTPRNFIATLKRRQFVLFVGGECSRLRTPFVVLKILRLRYQRER